MTRAQLRSAAFVVALGVGVTAGGVAAGALLLAPVVAEATQPAVTAGVSQVVTAGESAIRQFSDRSLASASGVWRDLPQPARRLWIPSLLGVLALTGFVTSGISLMRRPPGIRASLSAIGGAGRAKGGASRAASRPAVRAGGRTPKAVQALADSGALPSEISWRTGLSLDAVAMLLSIGAPPSATPTASGMIFRDAWGVRP